MIAGRQRRVLVVVQNLPYEFDRRVRMECTALRDAGYGVTVVCPQASPDELDLRDVDGVLVRSYPAPAATSGLLSYVLEFVVCWLQTARLSWRVHRAEGFDVLQACNPPDTYWLLGLLWKVRGKRFVYDQHDLCPEVYEARFGRRGPLHRALLLLERMTYRVADHVICPNASYQEVATVRGRVPVERTTIVMSCPDPDAMRRGPELPELRRGREHLVCYVGIMGPQDGVDRLLLSVRDYVTVLGRRDCHFALLGYGDSLDDLRDRSAQLGLQEWVTFTGRVDQREISRYLSTASVGVTPDPQSEFNHRSTMNKTLEYMAHELPVVATDLVETRRSAGDAAIYVETPSQLAEAVAALLDDDEERSRRGKLGRHRIDTELRWDRFAADYVAALSVTGAAPVVTEPVAPNPLRTENAS